MARLYDEIQDGRYKRMSAGEVVADLYDKRIKRDRTSMTGREIADIIDEAEYKALSIAQKGLLRDWLSMDAIDPFGLIERVFKDLFARNALLVYLFNSTSLTLLAFAAARVETIDRVTEIKLGQVKPAHVEHARGFRYPPALQPDDYRKAVI